MLRSAPPMPMRTTCAFFTAVRVVASERISVSSSLLVLPSRARLVTTTLRPSSCRSRRAYRPTQPRPVESPLPVVSESPRATTFQIVGGAADACGTADIAARRTASRPILRTIPRMLPRVGARNLAGQARPAVNVLDATVAAGCWARPDRSLRNAPNRTAFKPSRAPDANPEPCLVRPFPSTEPATQRPSLSSTRACHRDALP